jgi:hypothetical protein
MPDGKVDRRRFRVPGRSQRVIRPGHDQLVGVEAESQPVIRHFDVNRDESRIFDLDRIPHRRRDQPMRPIDVAQQQRGEGADHGRAGDLAAIVIPAAVGGDPHPTVLGLLRLPAIQRRELAVGRQRGDLGKRERGQIGGRIIGHRQVDARSA